MAQIDYTVQLNNGINAFIEQYRNIPVSRLYDEFNINVAAKNRLNMLISNMMTNRGPTFLQQIEKNDLCLKTIKLDKYGKLKEAMSFPAFKYYDIANENWERSTLRHIFKDKHFVFAIFQNREKELYLNRMRIWKMPEIVLENGVKEVWKRMKECVTSGKIVKYIDDKGRYLTFFPSSSENKYVHVRPHAQNRNDTFPLPVPDKLTGLVEYPKHSYWLNRAYILKIISEG